MSQKQKLIIGPLPEQQDDYSHYEETVTRWDRIIAVIVVFVLMVMGMVYFFSAAFTDEEQSQTETLAYVESDQASLSALPEQTERLANSEAESINKSEERTKQTSSKPKAVATASAAIEPPSLPVQNTSQAITEETKANSVARSEQLKLKPAAKAEPQAVEASLASIKIHNPAIKEAILTLDLNNDVPGDPLPYNVKLNNQGIIKVMLYTEMSGLKGKSLYHEWYRNGIRQARVKIPVNVSLQKSYSSKFINKQMLGDWQVKVLNEKSDLFIGANFKVVENE